MKYYLYNTTDKTYFSKPVKNLSGVLGVTDICLDAVFKQSIQAVELTYIPNEKGNMLYFSNTKGKKGTLKIDKNLREKVFGVSTENLKATEKNPIVMAITKRIKLSHEANTYYRLLTFGEYMLIILLSGIIYIEDENGDWFCMQRTILSHNTTKGLEDSEQTTSILTLGDCKDAKSDRYFDEFCIMDVTSEIAKEYASNDGSEKNPNKKWYQYVANTISSVNSIVFKPDAMERFYLKKQKEDLRRQKGKGNTVDAKQALESVFEEDEFFDDDYEYDEILDLDEDMEEDEFSEE